MADIRVQLSDREIARLPVPNEGWYLARDTELKGFFVVVGRRKRTYTVQGDLRANGQRKSIRVSIGDTTQMSTREARSVAKSHLAQIARGEHPKPEAERRPPPPVEAAPIEAEKPKASITLDDAWARYRDGHMVRKGRSPGTIEGYRDHVERIFASWRTKTLKELVDDPALVASRHDEITTENGRYIANGAMRTLRAIYNHACKTNLDLPARNPVVAVDWHPDERRNTALGSADLLPWFEELAALENPIRREFHLFTLLSGCRPGALKQVRPEDIHFDRRVLHITKPKGGTKKAFDIPLSREMILCLIRALRFSRIMHPESGRAWVFASDSDSGHIVEQKEERHLLSKWGNDLRQSFRTLAQTAGVSEFDARLLMNHAVPGVNAGYITRHKLLEDHLRQQQQAISRVLMERARTAPRRSQALQTWLASGSRRVLGAAAAHASDRDGRIPSRPRRARTRQTRSTSRSKSSETGLVTVGHRLGRS